MSAGESHERTILLVDDDDLLLDMYSIKFREKGVEVKTAAGADEALRKLRDGLKFDAIVLDIVMPETDGFDLIEAIDAENLRGNAAVIVLSNQSGEGDRKRAEALNVDGYIVKASAVPSEVVSQVIDTIDA